MSRVPLFLSRLSEAVRYAFGCGVRSDVKVNDSAKAVLAATVSNVLLAAPANAGVLFDFNLTLPIIAGQFLVLMFILDKLIYTPVGDIIDKRDSELRAKITAVKDNSGELAALAVRSK
jgi:F-type H+-transporting ATPase subunit b